MKHLSMIVVLLAMVSSAGAQGLFKYDYEILTLGNGVNSSENDYAPSLSADRTSLFFTSYRSTSALGEADIWVSRGRSSRDWNQPVNPGSPMNGPGNDGSLSMTADGKMCVFASDDRSDGQGETDLYTADIVDGRISNITNMGPVVNSKYWESQPCISADGKSIYFISNRKGGRGGTDIYVTTRTGSTWGQPVNLGPTINTSKNERSPYVSGDGGILYFASNGIAGFGGYDIFMATKSGTDYDQPANLGSQINTGADEMFFFAPSKTEQFYFASSRNGGQGGLDIYAGTPNVFGNGMFRLVVSVLDSATRQPLSSVVSVVDMATMDTVATFTTNSAAKEYEQILPSDRQYRLSASVAGQSTKSENVTAGPPNSEQKVELLYAGLSVAEFNLGKYNVPFFVTGYYRPNTHKNLDELLELVDGPLAEATYIERFKKGSRKYNVYNTYADAIESILSTVVRSTTDDIVPKFRSTMQPGEVLEIAVTGYADPQPFVGTYVESESVSYVDGSNNTPATLEQGDRIQNRELSGLRAWYAGKELRGLLMAESTRGNKDFEQLLSDGRIVFRYVAGGESLDSKNLAAQRRIHIAMRITGGSRSGQSLEVNDKSR